MNMLILLVDVKGIYNCIKGSSLEIIFKCVFKAKMPKCEWRVQRAHTPKSHTQFYLQTNNSVIIFYGRLI